MKKNKRLVILGVVITLLYSCLVAFYLWNLSDLPGQYAGVEQETINAIEAEVEAELNTYPLDKENLTKLAETYSLDIVISTGKETIFQSSKGLTTSNFFDVVNKKATLFESQGQMVGNGTNYDVFLRIYQFPDDVFVVPFLAQQMKILGISFAILIVTLLLIIHIILDPLKRIKKSINHLSNYEFDKVEEGTDEINRKFSDLTTKIEDNMETISREYTNFEKELESQRQHLSNTLLVSRSFIHDLKTPIHHQLMENEIIEENMDHKTYTPDEVAQINIKHSENLMNRVNEVLRILNQDMNKVEEKAEDFDLIELTYETLRYFGEDFSRKGLFVDIDAEESLIINANYVVIQLLIHNLMSNIANYATKDTTVNIHINTRGSRIIMDYKNISSSVNIDRMKKSEVLFNVVSKPATKEHQFSSRNGLFIIKDLTELSKGTYSYTTAKDTITIHIDLPKKLGEV